MLLEQTYQQLTGAPLSNRFVLHEQKLISHWVKEREVGDQVLGWQRRLGNAAERRAGIDPGERRRHMGALKRIIGLNCPHKLRNDRAHLAIPFSTMHVPGRQQSQYTET